MEWTIHIKDKTLLADLPSYLLADLVLQGRIADKEFHFRWNALHQTFFISEVGSPLERCCRVRNVSVDYDSDTDAKRVRFHLSNNEASLIEALITPLSLSRATRSKVKKKRASRQFSPLTGKITKLYIKVGDTVRKGDQVAIIEAMKMENKILSEMNGVVTQVLAVELGKINMGDEIFTTSPLKH